MKMTEKAQSLWEIQKPDSLDVSDQIADCQGGELNENDVESIQIFTRK